MRPVTGGKLGKSDISRLAGVDFGELNQACGGCSQKKKGAKKLPMALFRVLITRVLVL